MNRIRLALACALALGCAASAFAAGVIKPLPQPDLSRLDKAQAETLQKTREAFETARKTLIGPPLAEAYALIAGDYARAGYPEIAEVALFNANAVAPEDGRWIYVQGVLASQRNQAAVARDYFEKAFAVDKKYLPIRVALVTALLAQGEVARAGQLVDEGIGIAKTEPKLYALRGEVALKQNRPADAVVAYTEALKLDPNANKLYGPLADALQAKGDAAGAAAARQKAGQTPPRLADPLAVGFSRTGPKPTEDPIALATFFANAGQYAVARQHLDRALQEKPGNVGILGMYARIEAMAGNLDAARARADAAIKAAPDDALPVLTRGVIAETAGNEDAARADYEKVIKADPKLAEPRLLLGNHWMRKGQYAQAIEQYRQLTVIDAERLENYNRLAAAQVLAGKCADALKDVDAGLRAHPRNALLVQLFVRLASTCRQAGDAERGMALDLGKRLYNQVPSPQITEALALAQAANGHFDEAVQLQGAAIFAAVRDGGNAAADHYRDYFQRFQARQLPERPWPATIAYYKPEPLRPIPAADAEPAK
ncbi:tetratricopeptide repeat protein [Tahibacter amnicola]|uniref:Tetratricopeptide repeat protein n=1 Tax=Tahibacter amnicola TaxID=2976241 RepID=A0ABY6BCQ4_9GAMM|nr:tetratricopeptide repeat protein [Tahibacter amnicola]UXI67823.1 tetratricopeptide repeat protein [Tahibacter amnicola]